MANISIIVPVYKVERYLGRCIDSILSQTYTDFELLLIDDGSPDKCGEICDKYAELDKRVHVIHQVNGGLSAARNTGIVWALNNSISAWLTFVDSDDWIHPQYLECLLYAVVNTNTHISYCLFSKETSYNPPNKIESFDAIVASPEDIWCRDYANATVAWGKLYDKKMFINVRYPEGIIHEDEFITYKLLFSYETISQIMLPLYYYYQNTNGIMLSRWTPARLSVLDAMLEQLQFFKEKGFSQAYCSRARRFVRLCGRSLEYIEQYVSDQNEKKCLLDKWLSILKQFVKENREEITFRGNPRGVLYTFPGVFSLCCYFRRLKQH